MPVPVREVRHSILVTARIDQEDGVSENEGDVDDKDVEKVKGTAKEIAGKVTGSDEWVREGQAQQEKAEAERRVEQAEEEQDRHSGS